MGDGRIVATGLDDLQGFDLASVRDDERARPAWTSRSTASVVLAALAVVFVVVAALVGDRVPLGPGRVLAVVLVSAWAIAAVFVGVHRPQEALAVIMAWAALVGALALLGAALAGRDVATATVRDFGAGLRGASLALLPAVGLHLVLSLPDGSLGSRGRRLWTSGGYVAGVVVAAYEVHVRPDVSVLPMLAILAAGVMVGSAGSVARYRSALTDRDRVRLQWSAWGVVVTGVISLAFWVSHELVSWPDDLRTVVLSTTVLVPLSLALGASERLAVRAQRLAPMARTTAGTDLS